MVRTTRKPAERTQPRQFPKTCEAKPRKKPFKKMVSFGLAHALTAFRVRQTSGAGPRPGHPNGMAVAQEQKITRELYENSEPGQGLSTTWVRWWAQTHYR